MQIHHFPSLTTHSLLSEMTSRTQNKPLLRTSSNKNNGVDVTPLDKRGNIRIGGMVGTASSGRERRGFVAANAGECGGAEGSECGTIEFSKEVVEALLSEKIRAKKFDHKGKVDQMSDIIKKLRLCIKWFQEVEKDHIQEQEMLRNSLESSEQKCRETEAAMKYKEEELNAIIVELRMTNMSLQETLTKQEYEKLDAIECYRREKEARDAAEKLQCSLREELGKAELEILSANQRVTSLDDMYERSQEYITDLQKYNSDLQMDLTSANKSLKLVETEKGDLGRDLTNLRGSYNSLQEQLTSTRASQDEAVKQKEALVNEVGCLRGELQQVRDERDRQLRHVETLNAEILKYKESKGT